MSTSPQTAPTINILSKVRRGIIGYRRKGLNPALVLLMLILAGAALLYFVALTPASFGSCHDDSIFVTTAKALATGKGYRIIGLPHEPVQTKSPPFYPFLLSLIWRAYPNFPQSLTAMMLVSMVTALSFLAMAWRYMVKLDYTGSRQALVVVALTAFNVYTVIYATTILAEMLYALLSVLGLYWVEKYARDRSGWITGAASGVIIGLAFLTRSSGIALLIAVTVYFVMQRQWRRGWLPVLIAGLFVVGWIGWCYLNETSQQGANAAYHESYFHTFNAVVNGRRANGGSAPIVILDILAKNAFGLVLISIPLLCLGVNLDWIPSMGGYLLLIGLFLSAVYFLFIAKGFLRHSRGGFRLLHLYVITYISLHLLWPYTAYDRFLIPLLPFLLLFLITEFENLISLVRDGVKKSHRQIGRRISAAFVGVILVLCASITLYNYGSGIRWGLASTSIRKTNGPTEEHAEALEWIRANTDPSDVLVCERDLVYYLYTDRKAARSTPLKEEGLVGDQGSSLDEEIRTVSSILNGNQARYLILDWSGLEGGGFSSRYLQAYKGLIEENPQRFVVMFNSADGHRVIYRIDNNGSAPDYERDP